MALKEVVKDQITTAFAKSLEVNTTIKSPGCCIAFAVDAGLALWGKPPLEIEQYVLCARVVRESGEQPLFQVAAMEQQLITQLLDSVGVRVEMEYQLFVDGQQEQVAKLLNQVSDSKDKIALIGTFTRTGAPHLIAYLGKDGEDAVVANNQVFGRLGQRSNSYGVTTLLFNELLNQAVEGGGIHLITFI